MVQDKMRIVRNRKMVGECTRASSTYCNYRCRATVCLLSAFQEAQRCKINDNPTQPHVLLLFLTVSTFSAEWQFVNNFLTISKELVLVQSQFETICQINIFRTKYIEHMEDSTVETPNNFDRFRRNFACRQNRFTRVRI